MRTFDEPSNIIENLIKGLIISKPYLIQANRRVLPLFHRVAAPRISLLFTYTQGNSYLLKRKLMGLVYLTIKVGFDRSTN